MFFLYFIVFPNDYTQWKRYWSAENGSHMNWMIGRWKTKNWLASHCFVGVKGSLFYNKSLQGTKNEFVLRIPNAKKHMWTPVHPLRKESFTMNFCNRVKRQWATLPTTNHQFEPCFDPHGENFMEIFTTLSMVIWFSTGTLGIFANLSMFLLSVW